MRCIGSRAWPPGRPSCRSISMPGPGWSPGRSPGLRRTSWQSTPTGASASPLPQPGMARAMQCGRCPRLPPSTARPRRAGPRTRAPPSSIPMRSPRACSPNGPSAPTTTRPRGARASPVMSIPLVRTAGSRHSGHATCCVCRLQAGRALRDQQALRNQPEIRARRIDRPIFITGGWRTGTTRSSGCSPRSRRCAARYRPN